MAGFLINESLSAVDPEIQNIIELEAERQNRKLIFIPSESAAPLAIREALGSILQNLYAEGYPGEKTRKFVEEQILDVDSQIANFHRYSDPRYYKGVEFADILEELARRRCAELFATKDVRADDIFVNVQPLSGAPANNAVYHALINPGDTIVGMNLFHGGHLTHGSPANRSGKLYNVVHYNVNPETEKIDYDEIEKITRENNPRVIIAGYSSYPWVPDWARFREIADTVGAYLLADISHIAGMVAADVISSPVGYADIITFTTHKTLIGPRGACILTFKESLSKKIDRAVFPGEQGGPHIQVIAAMAASFKLAKEKQFRDFQKQVVANCKTLSDQLEKRGLRIAYSGTNTHLTNFDCKSNQGEDGTYLSGDMAARIMDIVGLVANANVIPGDKSSFRPSGIRLGTPWLTQRGLVEKDMIAIADIIADLIFAIKPYGYKKGSKTLSRAKIDFQTLENIKIQVREITDRALQNGNGNSKANALFYFIDEKYEGSSNDYVSFQLESSNIRQSLNFMLSSDIESLTAGNSQTIQFNLDGEKTEGVLTLLDNDDFILSVPSDKAALAAAWLKDLSSGFVLFDEDLFKRIPGPFVVKNTDHSLKKSVVKDKNGTLKPFYIGVGNESSVDTAPLPDFSWKEINQNAIKKTSLHSLHVKMGAKMVPFAGWEMPVWYSSVLEEHIATRNAAGLFDVSHMGVFQAEGPHALSFLDCVCANDISALEIGESCYTHFLTPDAHVIDDLLVYYHQKDKYLVVVNASNDEKDWAWLNAVKDGKVKVDNQRPWSRAFGSKVILLNLRDPKMGKEMRVDIALQGPRSREILSKIGLSAEDVYTLNKLKRTQLGHVTWDGIDLIISRTGYTGEKVAYEIFIHPDKASKLWNKLLEVGEPLGMKLCGLGARDSLRTEAGLPLYGHEMGGELNLGVGEAAFGSFVKTYKPWFIGRSAYLSNEAERKSQVVRFRFVNKRVRMAHSGDVVLNERGKIIGQVTSCAIDKDEYLTGQAFIDLSYSKEGNTIYIYQGSHNMKPITQDDLKLGKKVQIPEKAMVLSRFPKL